MEIKLMSFNLRTDSVEDKEHAWPNRAGMAASFIEQEAADLVGTQEGLAHMLQDIRQHLPGYASSGKSRQSQRADEHVAIFHRTAQWQVLESQTFWLSPTTQAPGSKGWGARWPRICTWATYASTLDPARKLTFYNVHLDNYSALARLEGLKLVWSVMEKKRQEDGLPFVLAGDFNTSPDTEPLQWLADARMEKSGLQALSIFDYMAAEKIMGGKSYHGFLGGTEGQPIDFIFISSDLAFSSAKMHRNQVDGLYLSDHYPLSCTISLC